METLQSTIFIEFDVNTKKITFLRGDNIIDYDSNVTSIYVRVKYKNLSGNTVYLTPSELEDYEFSLYTMKPATNNVNVITGEVTDELKENVYGGVVKFEIPRVCTNRLGIVKCEIHINKENKRIGSSTFVLDVKQSLVTEFNDALLEDEDFPVLKRLIYEVQNGSNINDTTPSEITTYSSNKIENIKEDLNSRISVAYEHSQSIHAPSDAEANIQVDWNETDTTSDSYIKNKPTNLATIDDIPNNVSELTNDINYASETFVTNKIAEASSTNKSIILSECVTKEIGNANQITFSDGQTFQAKLDAGILKGDKGDQGLQGIQGEKGDKGDKGDTGEQGIQGIQGLKGDKGDKGDTGEQGIQGERGATGTDGATFTPSIDTEGNLSWTNNKGLVNPITVNIKGDKGDKGDTGEQGIQGLQGLQGLKGDAFTYEDFTPEQLESLRGPKGDTGADGQDGLTTNIVVNGNTYSHSNGTITLPNYPTVVSSADGITIQDAANNFTATNVEGALAELFQFVSNGKTLIASAITDMGVDASNTDSFEVMANKIRTIIGKNNSNE